MFLFGVFFSCPLISLSISDSSFFLCLEAGSTESESSFAVFGAGSPRLRTAFQEHEHLIRTTLRGLGSFPEFLQKQLGNILVSRVIVWIFSISRFSLAEAKGMSNWRNARDVLYSILLSLQLRNMVCAFVILVLFLFFFCFRCVFPPLFPSIHLSFFRPFS
jgi:hypothetical protein